MRTGKLVVVALLVALGISGAGYASTKHAAIKRTAPKSISSSSQRTFPRWQRISNCFVQRNWIVSVDTPSGGYAYVRGGGIHFQQWVAWWVVGKPGFRSVTATNSGLLTDTQETVGKACVGPALNP